MAPPLRSLRRGLRPLTLLPGQAIETFADKLSSMGGRLSPEMARALPDSKGGEEPKDLQRWRTDAYEMFTTEIGPSKVFYSADQWVKIELMLETAGPVAISTRAEITPVLSGRGRLLITNIPIEYILPKGSRLYYAAENINRVGVKIEPIPWAEQLSLEIRRAAAALTGLPERFVTALRGPRKPDAGPPPPKTGLSSGNPLKRLTPIGKPGKML